MKFDKILYLSLLGFAKLALATSRSNVRTSFYGVDNPPSDSAVPACDKGSHYNTKYYVAMNSGMYDDAKTGSDSRSSTFCDKCIKIKYKGNWVVGRIVDRCPGCPSDGGLDVSPTIFQTLEKLSTGIIKTDWEILSSCSQLGQSGSGGSSNEEEEPKKTTTRKTTTTTTRRTTTTTVARTTIKTTTKTIPAYPIPTINTPNSNGPIFTPNQNTTNPVIQPIVINTSNNQTGIVNNGTIYNPVNNPTTPQNPQTNINNGNTANPKSTNTSANKDNNKMNVGNVEDNNKDDSGSSATSTILITSGLLVSGAAGIGLIYAKRQSTDLSSLKEKFPEAFNNIKRSLSRSGTQIRRGLSRSGTALKRGLSRKGKNADASGLRTKKQYRQSLAEHFPGEPVQLYDSPVDFYNSSYPENEQPLQQPAKATFHTFNPQFETNTESNKQTYVDYE